ncbi:MAG: PEGA domain-containing protein [Pirellulales bacterium]|nr:PEGA domain-containing protein [Pirellulales bacterium]
MTIRSNPPGAMVYVDDYDVGTTPVSANFTYYGTRKIRLVKDGYETLTVMQPMPTPWYEIPPLDFFTENLLPGELRDRRVFTYQLRPQMVVQAEHLIGRAEQLRARGQMPVATAPPVFSGPSPLNATPSAGPLESIPTPQAQPPQSYPESMQPFSPNARPMQPAQPQNPPGYSTQPSSGQPLGSPGGWTPPPSPASSATQPGQPIEPAWSSPSPAWGQP